MSGTLTARARSLLGTTPVRLYIFFLLAYAATMSDRLVFPSVYNHYTYLADSFIHGRLDLVHPPPHQNDWAYHDGRWFVSFPPVPALVLAPAVAVLGWDPQAESVVPPAWRPEGTDRGRYVLNERPIVLLWAPLPVVLLFLILERLSRAGRSPRSQRENLWLSALFGLGTVYFPAAVQGDTWHIAHVIGATFLALYVLAALDARHPLLAGLCLGLAFGCRPTLLCAFPFFLYELARREGATAIEGLGGKLHALARRTVVRDVVAFGLPIVLLAGAWLLLNEARFGDPLETGHRFLQVRWLPRIERWGLFHPHYLPRNLAAALVLVPWATQEPPYFQICHHGMAIWLTTPLLLYLLAPRPRTVELLASPPLAHRFWPQWRPDLHVPLWICVAAVALPSLLYQNTGWVQFGYRFSIDYMVFFFMLLAIGGRRMTRAFWTLAILSVAVNLFGAITFNRVLLFYTSDLSQQVFFQPD